MSDRDIAGKDLETRWRNVYWFARMLINSDQYGGIGKNTLLMSKLSSALRVVIDVSEAKSSNGEIIEIAKATIKQILINSSKKRGTKIQIQLDKLAEDISQKLTSILDIYVLIFACEQLLIPINGILKEVPNNDREFGEEVIKGYLTAQGEAALATVINLWDDIGVEGCLTAERVAVVRAFRALRTELAAQDSMRTEFDSDHIMTAFVQEVERRLAQKRKSRAGGSLEDVTRVILEHLDRELKAKILSNAIIDAIVSENPILSEGAKEWLLFFRTPTQEDISQPLGFVAICEDLGLSWRILRRDLRRAAMVDPPKRKLCIVSCTKLSYNPNYGCE